MTFSLPPEQPNASQPALLPLSAGPIGTPPGSRTRLPLVRPRPQPLRVHGIDEEIEVEMASDLPTWEEALELVAENYRKRGYEDPDARGLRFTPYHALPDTAVFVARKAGEVVATLSLVMDNSLLGLPLECIFAPEVHALRQEGRRLLEVTSLADRELRLRHFVPVFVTLLRLSTQFGLRQGADTWVITVNPRHQAFYQRMIGFVPLGPSRPHPSVKGHPALAYKLDVPLLENNAPDMHRQLMGEPLAEEMLRPRQMPPHAIRHLGACSSAVDRSTLDGIMALVHQGAGRRHWA
jgi:hypothetical protein